MVDRSESGSILRGFMHKRGRRDPKMDILLNVGYLLSHLPEDVDEFHIVGKDFTLVLSSAEDTLPDGTKWKMYFVFFSPQEGDGKTLFAADFSGKDIQFDLVDGAWPLAVEAAFNILREQHILQPDS